MWGVNWTLQRFNQPRDFWSWTPVLFRLFLPLLDWKLQVGFGLNSGRGRLQTHWTRNCSLAAAHPCAAVPWRVHSRWPGCCRWFWTSWRSTCRLWTTFGATWWTSWIMWTKLHPSCKPATRLKILYFFGWRMTRMPRQTNPFEKHKETRSERSSPQGISNVLRGVVETSQRPGRRNTGGENSRRKSSSGLYTFWKS